MADESRLLPVAQPWIGAAEIEAVTKAVSSGWVSSIGEFIEPFERGFAAFCAAKHCVSVMNGTVALHLALATLGIGPGDEVIVPSLTFVATANVVRYCGATPVFVDADPATWCMDPQCVEEAITPATKAIIAVHAYGHPVDMDAINALARPGAIEVVEDAAEAHGALYRGKRVGGLSAAGVFSFYGNKVMTTGEGGALVTQRDDIDARARLLKDHGMSKTRRYWHDVVGFNYRMTNVQAALGVAQLGRIQELLAARETCLEWYRELLQGIPELGLNPREKWATPVNWLVCLDFRRLGRSCLERVLAAFRERKIDYRPFFVPMHRLPPYQSCRFVSRSESASVADALADLCINVPSGYGLRRRDVDFICGAILNAVSNG